MAEVLTLDEQSFDQVVNGDTPVLVDFWAPWCAPCRMMAPVVEQVAEKYNGKVKVGKVNVDENPELAGSFGIMSIPTLLIFSGGQVVKKAIGLMSEKDLSRILDGVIN